jgi:LPXTG-motif cell wall-anchored protein
MVRRTTPTGRLALAAVMGGLLALAQFAVPISATAAPGYQSRSVTATHLSIAHQVVKRGNPNSASVRVSSGVTAGNARAAAAAAPTGTVTLRVVGVATYTMALRNGRASHSLPTDLKPGTYRVVARYSGNDDFKPSSDSGFYTIKPRTGSVLGEDAGLNGGANRPGAVLGTGAGNPTGGLPATGSDLNSELLGLLGLALVGSGAGVMVWRRRRLAS